MLAEQIETKSRLIARILRDILADARFSSLAELTDSLKRRCGALRIRWTPEDIASAYQLVGSNRPLVDRVAQEAWSFVPEGRPIQRAEAKQLYAAIRRRYTQGLPVVAASTIAPEIDNALAVRLSRLSELAALEYFWLMTGQGADRLALLLLFSAVEISRPASWDRALIRREHEARSGVQLTLLSCMPCHMCVPPLSLHHVIWVKHGGSNAARNQVPLCTTCHAYLHPWLDKSDEPKGTRRFHSLRAIADGTTPS